MPPLPSDDPIRPPIQTIFWDVGGVLLTNGWDRDQRFQVLQPLGVDLVTYEHAHAQENFFWERGLNTAKEFFTRTVLNQNPRLHLTFAELWPLVCAESKLQFPETVEILRALDRAGHYRLATLNNESRELNSYRLDTFDLRRCFSFLISSAYVHEMKPAPRIYQDAIDICGCPAASTLFIDDKQENCDAATALGTAAIRFTSAAQLRTDLVRLGITV